jgi:hypothetical protein
MPDQNTDADLFRQRFLEQRRHARLLQQAYRTHRNNASARGIPFLLTYDEWFKIWINSGHLAERGRRRDQYCMARPNDVGPYTIDNVIIITNAENIAPYWPRYPSVPIEEVKQMRATGRSPTEIAEDLSISRMSVYRALRG